MPPRRPGHRNSPQPVRLFVFSFRAYNSCPPGCLHAVPAECPHLKSQTDRACRTLRASIAQNGHFAKTGVPILGSAKLTRPGRPPGALPRHGPAHAACFATSTTSFPFSRSISVSAASRISSHCCASVYCSTLLLPFPPRLRPWPGPPPSSQSRRAALRFHFEVPSCAQPMLGVLPSTTNPDSSLADTGGNPVRFLSGGPDRLCLEVNPDHRRLGYLLRILLPLFLPVVQEWHRDLRVLRVGVVISTRTKRTGLRPFLQFLVPFHSTPSLPSRSRLSNSPGTPERRLQRG